MLNLNPLSPLLMTIVFILSNSALINGNPKLHTRARVPDTFYSDNLNVGVPPTNHPTTNTSSPTFTSSKHKGPAPLVVIPSDRTCSCPYTPPVTPPAIKANLTQSAPPTADIPSTPSDEETSPSTMLLAPFKTYSFITASASIIILQVLLH